MDQISFKEKAHLYFGRRMLWYALGFFLFYAPFSLFTRALGQVVGMATDADIHDSCFRIPIQKIFSGDIAQFFTVSGISLGLMIVVAFIFGPLFCAKLCAPGGLSELISRYVPSRFQVDWKKYVDPVPIRYGFLVGFVIAPFLTGNISCAFCSFTFFEKIMLAGFWGNVATLSSSQILTALLWLFVFGVFTKGGRGYCNFMCPVGTVQNFFYSIGRELDWTYKLKLNIERCTNCGICEDECPMRALEIGPSGAAIQYSEQHCITCRQCINRCPQEALSYGTGQHGFRTNPTPTPLPLNKEPEISGVPG